MTTAVLWFRRDLRLADHPALLTALDTAARVLPVFVLDPRLLHPGRPRTERLLASVRALAQETDGRLVVRSGDPARVIPRVAREAGAGTVHVTGETTPFGRHRDRAVARALAAGGRRLVATGTPYAVDPGDVVTRAGGPYRVFTAYHRAWCGHSGEGAAGPPRRVLWARGVEGEELPAPAPAGSADRSGTAGERAARERLLAFLADDLARYAQERDRPDLDTTSRLSVPFAYGELHPRTVLAELAAHRDGRSEAALALVRQLVWREFCADVLWHHPESAWQDLRPGLDGLHDAGGAETDRLVEAWREGLTGYPLVDAGMRQLRAEGWMHNRVRMVTASFLTKDLHVWWPVGARHFLDHLVDGDVASNSQGWQWVAGTGADAAPYFRVLNPVRQGLTHDPHGTYVRRWVPELRHLDGPAAHEPWTSREGYRHGYPERLVDHAEERRAALARHGHCRRAPSAG